MERTDDIDPEFAAPPRRPLRWLMRGMLAVCVTLMALVVLSSPPVLDRIEAGTDWVTAQIGSGEPVAMLDDSPAAPPVPEVSYESPDRVVPQVSSMPTSRVPVRRGSISFED